MRANLPGITCSWSAVGGRYENEAERCDDGLWRMTLLEFEPTWTGGNPEVLAHVMPDDAPVRGV